jgi:hypothetical protein
MALFPAREANWFVASERNAARGILFGPLVSGEAAVDAIIFVRPTSQIPPRGRVAQLAEQLTLNQ